MIASKLTLMVKVPDRARADVMLTSDRVYYRFATTDTIEDGDIKGLGDSITPTIERILDAIKPQPGESLIPPEELKVTIFLDNRLEPTPRVSAESIRRATRVLTSIDECFSFLNGFA